MHQTRAPGDISQIYFDLKAGHESEGEGERNGSKTSNQLLIIREILPFMTSALEGGGGRILEIFLLICHEKGPRRHVVHRLIFAFISLRHG